MSIFTTVERIGESVVSVLGLDDSRFQDVLDGMTEDQREEAEAIHAERSREYEQLKRSRRDIQEAEINYEREQKQINEALLVVNSSTETTDNESVNNSASVIVNDVV